MTGCRGDRGRVSSTTSIAIDGLAAEGTRARRRRNNRRRIAEIAVELFERNGYAATTVDEIAAACDIGRRTFFRYFQNKEELLYPFLEESSARAAVVLQRVRGDTSPVAAMRHALLDVAEEFQNDAPFHLRCSLVALQQHHEGRSLADTTGPTLNDMAVQQTGLDLAEMMHVDPRVDPSPGLIAGCAITVFGSAYLEWIESGAATNLPALVLARFTLMCQLMAGAI